MAHLLVHIPWAFFAGIAVECDDVIIELNGFTISQKFEFYLQQRFFSLIELANKLFISGQGPGNFGGVLYTASNVIVQNGILGLSSHHGIHGNYATNIVIQNLVIKNFEVGGISLNGFDNVVIQNVEIGPNYENVPVTGIYSQGRVMLDRLRSVYENNPDGTIQFGNRDGKYTAYDVESELEAQMDMAFKYVENIEDYESLTDENDDNYVRWKAVKADFVNPRKLPVGSTVYGIFLNANGASVFGVGLAPGTSDAATLKNVQIHNLRNEPWETVRYRLIRGPFNDLLDLGRVVSPNLDDRSAAQYVGSAYSDAQMAINQLSDDWGVLGHALLTDEVLSWVQGEASLTSDDPIYCNSDVMLHVTKGIFGLRIDNVNSVNIDTVEISHLHNLGELGSEYCGTYWKSTNGGHHNQNYPIQMAYTGTEAHAFTIIGSNGAVRNVKISDVISARGDAFGIQIFPSNNLKIGGDILISDIHAGAYITKDDVTEPYLPNKMPRSCAIDKWQYVDEDNKYYENVVTYDDDINMKASCVTRHTSSCAIDYSYILENDSDEKDVGNWNEEGISDYEECSLSTNYLSSEEENESSQVNLLLLMSQRSDLHKQSLNYLYSQDNIEITDDTNSNTNENSKLSFLAWILVVVLAITSILIISFIIYHKCRFGEIHKSIVGSEKMEEKFVYNNEDYNKNVHQSQLNEYSPLLINNHGNNLI